MQVSSTQIVPFTRTPNSLINFANSIINNLRIPIFAFLSNVYSKDDLLKESSKIFSEAKVLLEKIHKAKDSVILHGDALSSLCYSIRNELSRSVRVTSEDRFRSMASVGDTVIRAYSGEVILTCLSRSGELKTAMTNAKNTKKEIQDLKKEIRDLKQRIENAKLQTPQGIQYPIKALSTWCINSNLNKATKLVSQVQAFEEKLKLEYLEMCETNLQQRLNFLLNVSLELLNEDVDLATKIFKQDAKKIHNSTVSILSNPELRARVEDDAVEQKVQNFLFRKVKPKIQNLMLGAEKIQSFLRRIITTFEDRTIIISRANIRQTQEFIAELENIINTPHISQR